MTQPLNGENDHRAFLELHWADFVYRLSHDGKVTAQWLYPSRGAAKIVLDRNSGEPLGLAPDGFGLVHVNYQKLLARYRLLILAYLAAESRCL